MNSNKLTVIEDLPISLEILDLGNNLIEKFENLKIIAPNLVSLNLKGNPICKLVAYKDQILAMFPTLRILDGDRFDQKFIERKKKRAKMTQRREKKQLKAE